MNITRRLAVLVLTLCSGPVLAGDKHVHGEVIVNLAIDAQTMLFEVQAPAIDILGFERRPKDDAQRRAEAEANAWFGSGRNMLGVPPSAGCRLQKVDFQPPKLGTGHADYRARYTFRCEAPQALAYVELWLLDRLQSSEKIEVNLITPTETRQMELTPQSARRIELR